jgi:hypothetical protein
LSFSHQSVGFSLDHLCMAHVTIDVRLFMFFPPF